MEGLSPQIVLLEESQKERELDFKTTNLSNINSFCDWFNIDQMESSYLKEERCGNALKRQTSYGNATKGLSPSYRRISPCSNLTKNVDVKFEHFGQSSCYIEQYRRAKQLKIEERLARIMQRKEKVVHGQKVNNFVEKSSPHSTVILATEENHGYPKQGRHSPQSLCVRLCGDTVKPSLPQPGYFAGRKWVYPKDFARVCSKNIGVKCGGSRTQLRKPDKQVHNPSRNMFLQGTGKPLNISCNKNWTVPRHRTACKSAPANRQNQVKHTQNNAGMGTTTQAGRMKSPFRSESLTCADLSALLEKHSITLSKQSLQTTPVNQSYNEHVENTKESVSFDSSVGEDSVEYEKIFRSVFDFYENSPGKRSHVYVNMGH